jgi:hypothetical protein
MFFVLPDVLVNPLVADPDSNASPHGAADLFGRILFAKFLLNVGNNSRGHLDASRDSTPFLCLQIRLPGPVSPLSTVPPYLTANRRFIP